MKHACPAEHLQALIAYEMAIWYRYSDNQRRHKEFFRLSSGWSIMASKVQPHKSFAQTAYSSVRFVKPYCNEEGLINRTSS